MTQPNQERLARGEALRRKVLGDDYVNDSTSGAGDFSRDFQELITEYVWGAVWSRPDLPLATRSLVNIAMLTALNRPNELKLHVAGALRNGCKAEQIREVLMQAAVYCGVPAAIVSFKAAREAIAAFKG